MSLNYQPAPRLSEIVRQVQKSLVHIRTDSGSGSGFVIDSAGYIITNAHVVSEHSSVEVEFVDGHKVIGVVLGRDEEIDLACVLVPHVRELVPISTADSDAEQVGEDVVAMGYPLGDMLKGEPTATRGIISAKRLGYLQTDASINPGNSGGPLVNVYGCVIGVNTWGIDRVGEHNIQGVGFAIPINIVMGRLGFLVGGGVVTKQDGEDRTTESREWSTHHFGEAGFSITLPQWWNILDSDQASASFSDGDSLFRISMLDSDIPLRDHAVSIRDIFLESARNWPRNHVTPLQRFKRNSWSFSYYGEVREGTDSIVGHTIVTEIDSNGDEYRPVLAQFRIPKDSPDGDLGLDEIQRLFLEGLVGWAFFHGEEPGHEWSINVGPGWSADEYNDYGLSIWSPEETAYLYLSVLDLNDSTSVQDLCRTVVGEHLERADAWERYEIISAHEDDYGDHEWYRMNYRYQGKEDEMVSVRLTQVGRASSVEYVIVADMFEDEVHRYAEEVDQMFASFWF